MNSPLSVLGSQARYPVSVWGRSVARLATSKCQRQISIDEF